MRAGRSSEPWRRAEREIPWARRWLRWPGSTAWTRSPPGGALLTLWLGLEDTRFRALAGLSLKPAGRLFLRAEPEKTAHRGTKSSRLTERNPVVSLLFFL